jgi:hypothetical protein
MYGEDLRLLAFCRQDKDPRTCLGSRIVMPTLQKRGGVLIAVAISCLASTDAWSFAGLSSSQFSLFRTKNAHAPQRYGEEEPMNHPPPRGPVTDGVPH